VGGASPPPRRAQAPQPRGPACPPLAQARARPPLARQERPRSLWTGARARRASDRSPGASRGWRGPPGGGDGAAGAAAGQAAGRRTNSHRHPQTAPWEKNRWGNGGSVPDCRADGMIRSGEGHDQKLSSLEKKWMCISFSLLTLPLRCHSVCAKSLRGHQGIFTGCVWHISVGHPDLRSTRAREKQAAVRWCHADPSVFLFCVRNQECCRCFSAMYKHGLGCVVNRGQKSNRNIGSCRVSPDDHKAWTTSSSMTTGVFTPPHAQGYAWPPSSSTLDAMIHAWGAKARRRRYPPGPMVVRPLRVKGGF
jgi:hypothetical protein